MNRLGAVFWLIVVVVSGFATFKAKYAIQDLEDGLAKVRKQTVAAQSEIRTLNAEWTYLNQPERLAELNKKFLNLTPIVPKQLQQRVEDIPLRTPPTTPTPTPTPTPTLPELVAEVAGEPPATPAPAVAAATASRPAPAPAPVIAAAAPPRPVSVAAAAAVPRPTPAVARGAGAHVQLAKAGPASLNSLIAQIAEVH